MLTTHSAGVPNTAQVREDLPGEVAFVLSFCRKLNSPNCVGSMVLTGGVSVRSCVLYFPFRECFRCTDASLESWLLQQGTQPAATSGQRSPEASVLVGHAPFPHVLFVRAQSCPTLCDPMDDSPPGSSVHRISRARMLQWVATSSSRGSS